MTARIDKAVRGVPYVAVSPEAAAQYQAQYVAVPGYNDGSARDLTHPDFEHAYQLLDAFYPDQSDDFVAFFMVEGGELFAVSTVSNRHGTVSLFG